MRRILLPAAVVACLAIAVPAEAQRDPYGSKVRNILTPGETGKLPPDRNSTDQLRLYDALTPLMGDVSAKDVRRLFKSEAFGVQGRGRVERTRCRGARIVRDRFNVAHVTARKRSALMCAAGWVTAEDRGLLLEFGRNPGRIAAVDAPGIDAFGLVTSARTVVVSPQAEAVLSRQITMMKRLGAEGRQMIRDIDSYVDGLNAFRRATKNPVKPYGRNDVLAAATFVGSIFGNGGGDEVRNSQFLASLQQRLGPGGGQGAFLDLMAPNDAESAPSIAKRYRYNPISKGPTPGSLLVDPGSLDTSAARSAARPARRLASNALLVSGDRSATGRSLAVMGPQLGYFYPEIVMEMELHGGGIDAAGSFIPGAAMYPLIGRGKDYAWSLTSASNDNTDEFLEELCNPNGSPATRTSRHYLYKGRCTAMSTFNAGVIKGASGGPDEPIVFPRTVHGSVSGTVTVKGKPYAIAKLRSGYGRDTLSLRALKQLGENKVREAKDFARVANQFDWTFNWHYVDDRDIAYFSSGRLPKRAAGTNPLLPTLGTGRHDWKGFISGRQHPQAVNPRAGTILNWNNRSAPGWMGGDDVHSWGSVHRVELFKGFKRSRNRIEDVVSVMNRAATQDLRAVEVWPVIRQVLRGGAAPDARSDQAATLVDQWVSKGASRLDRALDGRVDDPGAAVMDRAWNRIADATLSPALGPLVEDLAKLQARGGGSGGGYGGGWYGYVDKDLRNLLGHPVRGRFSRRYCGGGDLPTCRSSLWAAVQAAADELAAEQGTDPNAWRSDAAKDRIKFQPGLIPDTMRWTNRPTFQQVVEFTGHRRRPGERR